MVHDLMSQNIPARDIISQNMMVLPEMDRTDHWHTVAIQGFMLENLFVEL